MDLCTTLPFLQTFRVRKKYQGFTDLFLGRHKGSSPPPQPQLLTLTLTVHKQEFMHPECKEKEKK